MSREPVPQRGMMRGHDDGVLGSDAGRDRLAHHAVHVPRVGDVLRVAIVRAEGDAPGPVLLDERQQRSQIPRHRRLADEKPHPRSQAFATFLDRERLVIGVDAGRRVRLEVASEQTGRVPVDVPRAVECELLELGGRAADDAGEVHHLREPEHPPAAHERLEIAGRQRPARRLEAARRERTTAP